jgi:hypothetical protein
MDSEVQRLFEAIYDQVDKINSETNAYIEADFDIRNIVVRNKEFDNKAVSIALYWSKRYRNTLDGSYLKLQEMIGRVLLPRERGYQMCEPKERSRCEFYPDFQDIEGLCWRKKSKPDRYYKSDELAEYCINAFLELVSRANKGEFPNPEF